MAFALPGEVMSRRWHGSGQVQEESFDAAERDGHEPRHVSSRAAVAEGGIRRGRCGGAARRPWGLANLAGSPRAQRNRWPARPSASGADP
jgi:hypothetical protein